MSHKKKLNLYEMMRIQTLSSRHMYNMFKKLLETPEVNHYG